MIVAGHTSDSATLQASLGFARTFFNVISTMPLMALSSYFANVVPAAVGARRMDRLARYLYRSILLVSVCLLPSIVLLCFAKEILLALGVPALNADGVGIYCRMMVATTWLSLLDNHLETLFINLGYVKMATLNALLTGLGLDVGCAWLFVYRLEWGIWGCALVQIVVRLARVLLWLVLVCANGLRRTMLVPPPDSTAAVDPILSRVEGRIFLGQCLPQYLAMLAGWLVFEMQLVLLTNIPRVSHAARAAGADWINVEGTIAACQGGWIQVSRMRCLKLLSSADPGASHAFALLLTLSFGVVAALNVPLLLPMGADGLSRLMTNDDDVHNIFRRLVWVLALHSQTRIVDLTCGSLLVPMGWPRLRVAVTFVSFWCVATPLAMVGALTDAFTTSMLTWVQIVVAWVDRPSD